MNTESFDAFINYFSIYGKERLDGPPTDIINKLSAAEKTKAYNYVLEYRCNPAGQEAINILFALDKNKALIDIEELEKTGRLTGESMVVYSYEKYQESQSPVYRGKLFSLLNHESSEVRNLSWYYLPTKGLTNEEISVIKACLLKEADKVSLIQGIKKFLSIFDINYGTDEYTNYYRKMRLEPAMMGNVIDEVAAKKMN